MGVDMVEIDIQRTADGQFVLMHDATLDRTSTGKGRVSDYTLDHQAVQPRAVATASRPVAPYPPLRRRCWRAVAACLSTSTRAATTFARFCP